MSAPFRRNNCVPMWLTHGNDREYIYIYIYIYIYMRDINTAFHLKLANFLVTQPTFMIE